MRFKSCLIPLAAIVVVTSVAEASAQAMVREQKVISSAGARAMVDACTAWAERSHTTVAMSVLVKPWCLNSGTAIALAI